MLALEFDQPTFERDAICADYDLEIGVVATFSIRISKQVIYDEVMFPVVELRVALDRWVRGGPDGSDFELVSMESDEAGLVWLRRQPSGSWRVGSIHQNERGLADFEWERRRSSIPTFREGPETTDERELARAVSRHRHGRTGSEQARWARHRRLRCESEGPHEERAVSPDALELHDIRDPHAQIGRDPSVDIRDVPIN
jgi:hypothetical protein